MRIFLLKFDAKIKCIPHDVMCMCACVRVCVCACVRVCVCACVCVWMHISIFITLPSKTLLQTEASQYLSAGSRS